MKINELFSLNKFQYFLYTGLSLVVVLLAGIMTIADISIFRRYFGTIHPMVVFLLAVVCGIILLSFFLLKTRFVIYRKTTKKRLLILSGIPVLLVAGIIIVDCTVIFPRNMNVMFPWSLLFYPALGFIVEIFFHLFPLAILTILFNLFFNKCDYNKRIVISIILVSLAEPIFQTIKFTGHYPLWAAIYTGFHILLINLFQLWIFKRYDLLSMYAFRFIYYLLWHVIWGTLRLEWLF